MEGTAGRDIAGSIRSLGAVLGLDPVPINAALEHLFFDRYAEVVLLRDGLEVIVGGVGLKRELLDAAGALGVPAQTMRLFDAFSSRFLGRIGYLKLCFGENPARPTMHCGAMTRWSEVVAFVAEEAAFVGVAKDVAALRDGASYCSHLAFSSDAHSGQPIMKIYWLLDQHGQSTGSHTRPPTMACVRIVPGGVRPECKRYWLAAQWSEAGDDERWRQIIAAAQAEFSEDVFLCVGKLLVDGAATESKLYMFVQDSRMTDNDWKTAFNLHYFEGMFHLHEGDFRRAEHAFGNAFIYQPTNAHAINNRGFCRLQLGNAAAAVADFDRALCLDPAISPANRDYALSLSLAEGRPG